MSDGILRSCPRGQSMKVLWRPNAPMNNPSSSNRLSLGASLAVPRLTKVSSGDRTRTAKSTFGSSLSSDSMGKVEALNTPSVQSLTTIGSWSSADWMARPIWRDSPEQPINSTGRWFTGLINRFLCRRRAANIRATFFQSPGFESAQPDKLRRSKPSDHYFAHCHRRRRPGLPWVHQRHFTYLLSVGPDRDFSTKYPNRDCSSQDQVQVIVSTVFFNNWFAMSEVFHFRRGGYCLGQTLASSNNGLSLEGLNQKPLTFWSIKAF